MTTTVAMNSMLDQKMTDTFDWSNSQLPVRDAVWNHYMDANNHDTDKTADEVEPYMKMNDTKLKQAVEKLLKA